MTVRDGTDTDAGGASMGSNCNVAREEGLCDTSVELEEAWEQGFKAAGTGASRCGRSYLAERKKVETSI